MIKKLFLLVLSTTSYTFGAAKTASSIQKIEHPGIFHGSCINPDLKKALACKSPQCHTCLKVLQMHMLKTLEKNLRVSQQK
jgi:hypothetical protein